MYKEDILLSDIETVKRFVTFVSQFEFPVTLFSDKYIVNGKSIMGIFGLDLSKPVQIEVPENCTQKFIDGLKEFAVAKVAV